MLGNLLNRARSVGSKVLGGFGSALKTIGDIGGQAIRTIGSHAGLVGTGLGTVGAALTGNPALISQGAQIGGAIQGMARNKATQNSLRAINDVGKAASSASSYLGK